MHPKFRILTLVTLVSIFLVVLAGGVVRMTGSGMGCPDWPKCFDCYIPPTDVSQLPENYKDIYSAQREKKIERFAKFLTSLGFEAKAKQLLEDKSLLEEQDFSAFNTWTEYINRLCGALAGMFILIQMIWAFANFRKQKLLAALSFFLFILTLFQAWFGAMVVATNIVPWVLTVHMMLAIVMILVQLHIISIVSKKESKWVSLPVKWLFLGGVLLMVLQTVWGTQVRQQVDVLAESLPRDRWVEHLEGVYFYHRSMAIAMLLMGISLFFIVRKKRIAMRLHYWILGVILLEAVVGRLFSALGMPAILQPIHLLLSMTLIAMLYYGFINTKRM